jgi:mono/diheme cytochrome c family protein
VQFFYKTILFLFLAKFKSMKKIIALFSVALLLSCGSKTDKKKGFEYQRTPKETKTTPQKTESSVPVDLSNKGIGPITEVKLDRSVDTEKADQGATLFKQKCTACHMTDKKLIGPAMSGVLERRSPEWVMNLLLNPTEMLKQDAIANALLKEYNNVMMLNQNLSEEEARSIVEYLRTL